MKYKYLTVSQIEFISDSIPALYDLWIDPPSCANRFDTSERFYDWQEYNTSIASNEACILASIKRYMERVNYKSLMWCIDKLMRAKDEDAVERLKRLSIMAEVYEEIYFPFL